MDKLRAWWAAHKPTRRRLIQVYAALLYNAHIKGFIDGEIYTGPLKNVCVPGFNCYSCPGAAGACPLGALQNALASSGNRAPAYVLGILMLFGLTLGRTICGWLCPLGLIQELLHKIPTPKLRKNRFTRALSWLKYVILVIFVVIIPLSYSVQKFPVPAFCKYICPAGTFEGAIGLLSNPANADKFSMLGILFTRKFVIMVAIFTACVFVYRAFCRFICPLGAIYGLFARISLLGVKVDAKKCTDCGRCVSHCKVDIRHVGDHECIQCGSCIGECPTGAISWKGGKLTLRGNEVSSDPAKAAADKKRRKMFSVIGWGCALALLIFVLWFTNKPENNAPAPTQAAVQTAQATEEAADVNTAKADATPVPTEAPTQKLVDDTPVGKDVGMRCPDFTVPLYGADGGEFALSDYKGKPVVINFWATWCTPCVNELPHFQQLYEKWSDKIGLVAIHSELVTDDVQEYLDAKGYSMPFALDTDGSVIKSLGGSTMLPMTVVLDADGKIVYNKVGSVTYELIESLVEPLIQDDATADETAAAQNVETQTQEVVDDTPVGKDVGMRCPDFTVPLYGADGGEFALSDYKGKPVVINFWATWCTPCVNELPHFQQLYEKWSDKIGLVAIHSELVTDDVQEYLDAKGYSMPFALDTDGSVIKSLGGSTMLPMTVVLDADGKIVYNKVGSVTYELIESLVEPLVK